MMALSSAANAWTPIIYDTSKSPILEATLGIESDPKLLNNFPRNAKWSPDGSVILSQCENRTLKVFDTPKYTGVTSKAFASLLDRSTNRHQFLILFGIPRRRRLILLPFALSRLCENAPSNCLMLQTVDFVLHIASLTIERDRLLHIVWSSILLHRNSIAVLKMPSNYSTSPVQEKGLGIISAIAFSPSYNTEEFFYAAGSFSPTSFNIAMFSDQQEQPLMFVQGGPRAGVTQLQFNPAKPHMLYAAYRGFASGSVYSWDIRSHVNGPLEIFTVPSIKSHESAGQSSYETITNQKMRFDIDQSGQLLSMGDRVGNISIFDLAHPEVIGDERYEAYDVNGGQACSPKLWFKAHNDAVGSTAFHPLMASLLSVSGSRHFIDDDEGDDDYSNTSDEEATSINNNRTMRRSERSLPVTIDPSIKIWDFRRNQTSSE